MPAAEVFLAIEVSVVGSAVCADKVCLRAAVGETAADNLFDFALVQIDTRAKLGQGDGLCAAGFGGYYSVLG